jgi:hypothetical protein
MSQLSHNLIKKMISKYTSAMIVNMKISYFGMFIGMLNYISGMDINKRKKNQKNDAEWILSVLVNEKNAEQFDKFVENIVENANVFTGVDITENNWFEKLVNDDSNFDDLIKCQKMFSYFCVDRNSPLFLSLRQYVKKHLTKIVFKVMLNNCSTNNSLHSMRKFDDITFFFWNKTIDDLLISVKNKDWFHENNPLQKYALVAMYELFDFINSHHIDALPDNFLHIHVPKILANVHAIHLNSVEWLTENKMEPFVNFCWGKHTNFEWNLLVDWIGSIPYCISWNTSYCEVCPRYYTYPLFDPNCQSCNGEDLELDKQQFEGWGTSMESFLVMCKKISVLNRKNHNVANKMEPGFIREIDLSVSQCDCDECKSHFQLHSAIDSDYVYTHGESYMQFIDSFDETQFLQFPNVEKINLSGNTKIKFIPKGLKLLKHLNIQGSAVVPLSVADLGLKSLII